MCKLESGRQSGETGVMQPIESYEQVDLPCPAKQRSQVSLSSCCCCIVVIVLGFIAGGVVLTRFHSGAQFQFWGDTLLSVKFSDEAAERKLSEVQCDMHQWFLFLLLAFIASVNAHIVVPGMLVIVGRRFGSISRKLKCARQLEVKPTVDCIVPCYLPNEHEIIEETVWHILNKVESPGEFKLWLVYNTPHDMPEIEARLRRISECVDLPHGRKMTVVRAETSRSKAENINLVLPDLTGKYTVIYDADHHPDPESLMLMLEKIMRRDLACVQGSTYIRNLNSGLLARIVDAEFFVTHFATLPTIAFLFRTAFFCGSNGVWQTSILQTTRFNPEMQTEDIDVSIRMQLERHRIDFCPESRSGELAPVSLGALMNQRTRWAMGWDQVSIKLYATMAQSDASCCCKLALSYVCWSRWVVQILSLVGGLVLPVVMYAFPELSHCGHATHIVQIAMLSLFCIFSASILMEAICQSGHRGLQSWIQVIFVFLYLVTGLVMMVFQACLTLCSLYKIATGNVGGWVVTARESQKAMAETYGFEDVESLFLESSDLREDSRVPLASGGEASLNFSTRVAASTAESDIDGL